jgi:hypothetical protein
MCEEAHTLSMRLAADFALASSLGSVNGLGEQ